MRKLFLEPILLLCCGLVLSSATALAEQTRSPNVIIIYSDDHGYTDLGLFRIDSNVRTPHMDSLARGGVLITNGYSSAPQCRPSRCGLMAGRIQNEFGFSQNHSNSGEGEGAMPRTYPPGTDMAGQPLLTIADRMKALGYVTGFSGKWHCGDNEDKEGKYDPRGRGFDEYWVGPSGVYHANFDLDGKSIPHQRILNRDNRVIVQGKAAEAFIKRNKDKSFFLYFPIYGPHAPLIDLDDPYYKNFPAVDYPHYNDAQDDIRRRGLALLHAMDDAVGGVMKKLREHGLEENTLILFAGDNGAPTMLRTGGGTPDVNGWNGSCNVPMRGAKGNLLEGGIRVPMFAYWKGTIPAGQVIDEMVTTLDFTATTLAAGGGELPDEFDGVDILPRLTGKSKKIAREKPMFWDFFEGQAVRLGDWKLWRNGSGDRLFHIAKDPSELNNVIDQHPEQAKLLQDELDKWVASLRPDSQAGLAWDDNFYSYAVTGAPEGVQPDPRYLVPYDDPAPKPYPLPIAGEPKPHGKVGPKAEATRQPKAERTRRGKAGERSRGRTRQRPGGSTQGVAPDGWLSAGDIKLSSGEGSLIVENLGDRGFFTIKDFKPIERGPFTLTCRMKSTTVRRLSIFYNKPSRDRLINLTIKKGDAFKEYKASIPAETLEGLRFNPSKDKGEIEINCMRIVDGDGKVVGEWEFKGE